MDGERKTADGAAFVWSVHAEAQVETGLRLNFASLWPALRVVPVSDCLAAAADIADRLAGAETAAHCLLIGEADCADCAGDLQRLFAERPSLQTAPIIAVGDGRIDPFLARLGTLAARAPAPRTPSDHTALAYVITAILRAEGGEAF